MKDKKAYLFKLADYGFLISVASFLSIILPFIIASFYSVLSSDDFYMMNGVLEATGNNAISKALNATYDMYFNWSGAYSGALVEYLIGYLVSAHWSIARVFLVVSNILILLAVYLFLREIMIFFGVYQKRNLVIIFTWVIISWWTIRFYQEVFYWVVGNIAYNVSLMACLFSLMLIIFAERKKRFYSLSVFFEFVTTGFAIQTGSLHCFFVLCLLLHYHTRKKDIKWLSFALCISILGELIRVLAPGNYVRHSVADKTGELHVVRCAICSVNSMIEYLSYVLKNPIVIITIILLFYFGFKELKDKVNYMTLLILALCFFIAMFIQIFPVLLGYSGMDLSVFANRTYYPLDFVTVMGLMSLSFISGGVVREYLNLKTEESVIKVIIVVAVLSVLLPNLYTVYLNTSRHTYNSLSYGEIQGYSKEVYSMFYSIQDSIEKDIEIDTLPVCPATFHGFDLSNNPSQSLNKAVAKFLKKESIWVKPI